MTVQIVRYFFILLDCRDCGQKSQVINNKYVNAAYNWMAPEVMDQYLFTEEGDVYSFASVIVEMLSGNPYAAGGSFGQYKMLQKNLKND